MTSSTRAQHTGRSRQGQRIVAVAIAMGLSAASCASSGTSGDAVELSLTTTTADSAVVDATETTETVAGEPVVLGQLLESVVSESPGPNGWLVPAGRWTTTTFSETVTFDTPIDLTLRSISKRMITFMNPANPDARSVLVLTTSVSAPGVAGTERPASRDAETLRDGLANHPHITLLSEGTAGAMPSGDDAHWWDFVIDEPAMTYPCWLGFDCVEVGVTSIGDRVSAVADTTTRVYFVGEDQGRFRLFVMGEQNGFDELAAIADQLASSLEFSEQAPDADAALPVESLRTIGLSRLDVPVGTYRTMIGSNLVEVDLPDGLPETRLIMAGEETLVFLTPSGFLSIFDPSKLVSADADQALVMTEQETPTDLISRRPETAADIEAWLSGHYEITANGEIQISGDASPWWETGRQLTGGPCPPEAPADAIECTKIAFSDHTFHWSTGDETDNPGRFAFLPGGLIANFAPITGTMDATLEELQPLFDALIIRPKRAS